MIGQSGNPTHQQISHKKTIDHQCNIVSNEHGSDKFGWFFGKFSKGLREKIILFFFYLKINFIGRNEGNLHTREKSTKK